MSLNLAETHPPPLFQIRDVSRTYHTGDVTVPVLHDVNLEIPAGELMVIVGPSGSGKSTLLNLVGGIDTPNTGQILFQGRDTSGQQDLTKYTDKQLTAYRRESVGFVFQFYNLVPTLTAAENVQVAAELSDTPLPVEEALALVGLQHRVNHFPSQMSGGEQQRVAIARAVAKNPELLLCDEPTGALDLETGRMILGVIHRLNTEMGMTVVIITHNSAIAGIAQRTVRIGSGTIAGCEVNTHRITPDEVTW